MSRLYPSGSRRTSHKHLNHPLWGWLALSFASVLFAPTVVRSHSADVQAPANQQHHDGGKPSESVAADRVPIGAEYVARRTDLPNALIVAPRKVGELPEEAT